MRSRPTLLVTLFVTLLAMLVGTTAWSSTSAGADAAAGPVAVDTDWAASIYHLSRSWDTPDLVYDEVSATAEVERLDDGGIAVDLQDASGWARMEFAAPRGRVLEPGRYDDATRRAFRTGHHPGLDVGAHGLGCNQVEGSFVVHRLTPDLRTVHISYVMRCDGLAGRVYGEVRIGADTIPDTSRTEDGAGAGGRTVLAPYAVQWPDLDPGVAAPAVPVRVVNDAATPLRVSDVAVSGPAAGDVELSHDCGSVPVGEACTVEVGFTPSRAGERIATLVLTTDGGQLQVPLAGRGIEGRTLLRLTTEESTTVMTPLDADLSAGGTEHGLSFGGSPIGEDASHQYAATLRPPSGEVLRPGTYEVSSDPFTTTDRGLLAFGHVQGCPPGDGRVTVREAAYDETSGDLERLLITWEQRCDDGPVGGLQGTFAWRARTEPPPPTPAVRWRADPVSDVDVIPGLGTARLLFTPPPGIDPYWKDGDRELVVRYRAGAAPLGSAAAGSPAPVRRQLSNSNGSVDLEGLAPGSDYTVGFFVTPDRTPRPDPTTVTLRGTRTSVSARRLRSGRTAVVGRVVDGDGGLAGRRMSIELRGAGGAVTTVTTTTDRRGRFSATGRGAGRVHATFTGADRHLGSLATAPVARRANGRGGR